jgi:hypothetical protein
MRFILQLLKSSLKNLKKQKNVIKSLLVPTNGLFEFSRRLPKEAVWCKSNVNPRDGKSPTWAL